MKKKVDSNIGKIDWIVASLIIGTVVTIWEIWVKTQKIPIYILPPPSLVIMTLRDNLGLYAHATLITFTEAIIGLSIGIFLGACIASILGIFPRLERGIMLLALLIKSTPLIAIAPMLTIWLGFGMLPKIIITAILSFFPVLINMLSGLRSVNISHLDAFRSWNASRWEIFWKLRLPGAIPYLFAALKVSGPLSLMGAVVAEWTGSSGGLGRTMWLAYTNLNLPYLFAAVIILAFAGILIYGLLIWLERKIIFWNNWI